MLIVLGFVACLAVVIAGVGFLTGFVVGRQLERDRLQPTGLRALATVHRLPRRAS